jgi:16S rRNA (guanine966-N2)-methyltransferase
MRVVGGTARGRRLQAPPGAGTRPTSDRVRESVFNLLFSLSSATGGEEGEVEGAVVVDLFAGTGALGIEALSRGAARAVFVETDPAALAAIRANLASTGLGPAEVVRRDALTGLDRRLIRATGSPGGAVPGEGEGALFDIAFCDPPYRYGDWPRLMEVVPARLVVAESDGPVGPLEGWDVTRSRQYGGTVVEVLRRKR